MINFTIKKRPVGNRFHDHGKEMVCPDEYFKIEEKDEYASRQSGR